MPLLPIFVFGSLFLAFSSQTLFGSNNPTGNEQADTTDPDDSVVAIALSEAELADAIANYLQSKKD